MVVGNCRYEAKGETNNHQHVSDESSKYNQRGRQPELDLNFQ